MPKHPRGGTPKGSIEEGLRELVLDAGPNFRKLSRGDSEGLRRIMAAANTPSDWKADDKASVILTVIREIGQQIPNPRWKDAALAAFRLPVDQYVGPEYDSLTGRWRALAQREGAIGAADIRNRVQAYRGYWMKAAVWFADKLEDRFNELNTTVDGWQRYRIGVPSSPSRSAPLSFDRTDVLYRFEGRRGLQSISYRWLRAHAPTDHYVASGWYYNQPDAPVEFLPLANCTLTGDSGELLQGGRYAILKFSHTLEAGEQYFFAYTTIFRSNQPCWPTILYEASRGIRSLTIRGQFDAHALPTRIWYFNVGDQHEGWETPNDDAPELLKIASNGYIDHHFENCGPGRKYGLHWTWPEEELCATMITVSSHVITLMERDSENG